MPETVLESHFLQTFWAATGADPQLAQCVRFAGTGDLPSAFAVTALAAGAMGAAGLALDSLLQTLRGKPADHLDVTVDRRLASIWFGTTIRPIGWTLPPLQDSVTGDYETSDGWIRLHANAPHHLEAALATLGEPRGSTRVADAVRSWRANDLESAIVANRGCAATMRSWPAWQEHLQGIAVLAEPLIHREQGAPTGDGGWQVDAARPLAGLRVLDMTRVLAGPACTRMLAGAGAEVLRIDPPWWDEPSLAPEMTLGKRCARLDLRDSGDREHWKRLLATADVLVHGYRSDALEAMGLGALQRQQVRPGLIDVSLDAYGHTGPWRARRGFDSLVQMSMGIAEAGQRAAASPRPVPLPVQALDHATGYLLATAVLRGLQDRVRNGRGSIARVSLARTAVELMKTLGQPAYAQQPFVPAAERDFESSREATYWGPALRARWPLVLRGVQAQWSVPSGPLGHARPQWVKRHDRVNIP